MIRGTTAQFKFKLPYNYDDISLVKIIFWQPNNYGPTTYRPLPIVKGLHHCNKGEKANELSLALTPEETLRFSDKLKAYTQLKGETIDGATFGSRQVLVSVYPTYDDIDFDDLQPTDDEQWVILDGSVIT